MEALRACVNNRIQDVGNLTGKHLTISLLLNNLDPAEVQKSDITVLRKAIYYVLHNIDGEEDLMIATASKTSMESLSVFNPTRTDFIFCLRVPALYYYMKYYLRGLVKPYEYFRGMRLSNSLNGWHPVEHRPQVFENLKSILTFCASFKYETQEHNFAEFPIYNAILAAYRGDHADNDRKFYHLLTYMIVDLGLHAIMKGIEFPPSRDDICNCVQTLDTICRKAFYSPLSLKRQARLVVRKCMREVDVLSDCYKLNIPAELHSYLSFRSLNAQVRELVLTAGQQAADRAFVSLDVVESLCVEYGVPFPHFKPDPNKVYCVHRV